MVLRVRKKRRRQHRSVVWQYWWVAPVLAGAAMIFWVATGPRWSRARIDLPSISLAGYTAGTPEVLQEYLRFYGNR